MTTTIQSIYDDYGCYKGSSYSQKIVAWMSEHGHTGYAREIADLQDTYMLTVAEAGRYWQHCEFTRESLRKINDQIEEVFDAAVDRYQDWASD